VTLGARDPRTRARRLDDRGEVDGGPAGHGVGGEDGRDAAAGVERLGPREVDGTSVPSSRV
jgi:hypothetical protein